MSDDTESVAGQRYPVLRGIVSMSILVVFIGWVAYYVSGHAEQFRPLADVSALHVAGLTLAFVGIMVCNGVFIAIVTQAFEIRLRVLEWLSLSFASSFANFFLPLRGGAGIRAVYMHQVHRFPISEFVSTLSIMYLMHVVVNAFLALSGMLLISSRGGPVNSSLVVLFSAIATTGLIAMLADFGTSSGPSGFPMAQVSRLLAAWRRVRQDRALVLRLWLLMLVLTAVTVWQCYVAFLAAGVDLPADGIIVYAACKNLGALIGLTPGSIGIVELISIYLGTVLGYGTADALLVQGLIRAVSIAVLLLAAPAAVLFLKHKLADADSGAMGERASR